MNNKIKELLEFNKKTLVNEIFNQIPLLNAEINRLK